MEGEYMFTALLYILNAAILIEHRRAEI